jgi:hypothetical protein
MAPMRRSSDAVGVRQQSTARRESAMHDLIIAVVFVFMLIGPCLVTLGSGKD